MVNGLQAGVPRKWREYYYRKHQKRGGQDLTHNGSNLRDVLLYSWFSWFDYGHILRIGNIVANCLAHHAKSEENGL